jgi:L-2-hydroxyglutarate oxidase LhgO
MLMVLHPKSEIYNYVVKVGGGETLTNAEMKKRYPALIAIPDDFVGYLAENAGVVKAREGLMATKKLSLEQGADLRYNTNVKSVDSNSGTVILENGQVLKGKHVVISCGPFSD